MTDAERLSQPVVAEHAASGRAEQPPPDSRWAGVLSRLGQGSRAKLAVKLLGSLAIAGVFVWLMRAGAMPLVPGAEAFERVRWWVVPLYLVAWGGVHTLRAARWQLLLAPVASVPLVRVFVASFIGYLAILVLPMRTGEVVRPMMIRRKGELSAWSAAGTIGAERIVDGLMLSVILFAALQLATPLDPLPETIGNLPISVRVIPGAAYTALVVFASALLVMGGFYIWKQAARRLVQAVLGLVSKPLSVWVADRVEHLSEGLSFLSRFRYSVPFVVVTALYWLLNAACTWLIGWGVGLPDFSYVQACVVTGVLALGILVPNAPGFFGAFQFSLYAGLAMFYPHGEVYSVGAAFVLLIYACQLAITFGFAGWAALAAGPLGAGRAPGGGR